jgi:CheY-specific phosphatase CheX
MEKREICALLNETLQGAADGIFEHLGVAVEYGDEPEAEVHDFACSIGFTSATLRGNLTLTAGGAFLAETRPKELRQGAASEFELCDWMGELGNQVLGRFKNRLLVTGNAIVLGTPAVLSGFQIQRRRGRMPLYAERLAKTEVGSLALHVTAEATRDFAITEREDQSLVMPEGELELF